jgi:TRAP-type C4-dicarboxylate transport system permease large subunit
MCCFVVKGLDKKISLGTVYKGVLPFIGALAVTIALVLIIPSLATCMPTWLGLI